MQKRICKNCTFRYQKKGILLRNFCAKRVGKDSEIILKNSCTCHRTEREKRVLIMEFNILYEKIIKDLKEGGSKC